MSWPAASTRSSSSTITLGPDLISDEIKPNAIARRARELLDGNLLLADALLDQHVACGIGNVYKPEVLFIEGWSPLTRLDDLTNAEIVQCYLRCYG